MLRRTAALLAVSLVGCASAGRRVEPGADAAPPGSPVSGAPPVTLAAADDQTCVIERGQVVCWGGGDATRRLVPGLASAVHVAVHGEGGCAARADGRLLCWQAPGEVATIVEGISEVVAVALDRRGTCVRQRGGAAVCWPDIRYLEDRRQLLDDGQRPLGRATMMASAVDLAVRNGHACAVEDGGRVRCWDAAWLIHMSNPMSLHGDPEALPGMADAVRVSAGDSHDCVIDRGGRVHCHGFGWFGQLGDGTFVDRRITDFVRVEGLAGALQIRAGALHSCALLGDRTVRCWGLNSHGQLGDGSLRDSAVPQIVAGLDDVRELAAGDRHTCARRGAGEVVCWGDASRGQLGPARPPISASLRRVDELEGPGLLAAGRSHTCIAHGAEPLRCLGRPSHEQMIMGEDGEISLYGMGRSGWSIRKPRRDAPELPWRIAVDGMVIAISAGENDTCVVYEDGAAACIDGRPPGPYDRSEETWLDEERKLPLTPPRSPWRELAVADVAQVALGKRHRCVRTRGGAVLCDGSNQHGQLGAPGDGKSFVTVTGLRDVVELAGHGWHTCARRASGEVVCWGANLHAQAGAGPRVRAPAPVPELGAAVAIAVSASLSCALDRHGVVRCVGARPREAIGRASVRVMVDGGAVAVAGSLLDVCALERGGTITCWSGLDGAPVRVQGIADAVEMVQGGTHICARRRSGAVVCAGNHDYGQLGGAEATFSTTPVRVWP